MKNKKKILFLIECFIVGGAERVLIDIVNRLDKNKYDITVCSVFKESVYSTYKKNLKKEMLNENIHFKYLINNKIYLLYIIFNSLLSRYPRALYSLLIGNRYDKVIAFYEGLPTYWISHSKIDKKKKIAWLHTSTELSQKGKLSAQLKIQEKEYKAFNEIIAVSQDVANCFTKMFPSLKDRVYYIYNPVNSNLIKQKSKEELLPKADIPVFVLVGRITEVKGYNRWLEVIKELKKNYQFKSFIIGGGNTNALDAYIKENELECHVEILGHRDNPYPYMKTADWIIVPSIIEGLSTVVMEGLILNKAILATNCPGMKELLGENKYGLVVENSKEGLIEGLKTILSHPELKEKFETTISDSNLMENIKCSITKIETILDA